MLRRPAAVQLSSQLTKLSQLHLVLQLLFFFLGETDTSVYRRSSPAGSSSSSSGFYSSGSPLPRRHRRHTPFMPEEYWKGAPEFGPTRSNVSVMVNGTAELRCPIGHVQDSAISFVRLGSGLFQILSNGHTLFTSDPRIEIVHRAKTVDWILRISRARFGDAGQYECQVSIKSGLYSLPFSLSVSSPRATILGSSEFHLDRGSTITLVCVVRQATTETQFVYWYRDSRVINYEEDGEGGSSSSSSNPTSSSSASTSITVRTAKSPSGTETNSTLTIRSAHPDMSGNYTCQPSNAAGASIQVFVSEDRLSEPLLRPDGDPQYHGHPTHSDLQLPSSSSSSSSGLWCRACLILAAAISRTLAVAVLRL